MGGQSAKKNEVIVSMDKKFIGQKLRQLKVYCLLATGIFKEFGYQKIIYTLSMRFTSDTNVTP